MGSKLTGRDLDVVVDIYKYRYLTTSQIKELHFPSLQTTNRRLRALTTLGLVSFFEVANVPERIYRLTSAGARSVAEALGTPEEELLWKARSTPPKDYYFMRHFAAVTDFRIMLTQACLQEGVELLGFVPEHYGVKHKSGKLRSYIRDVVADVAAPGEKIAHTPDGVFALQRDQSPALFFLEIDRGTESISSVERGIARMIRFYEGLAESGKYQAYAEDFRCSTFKNFRLLLVTTTEKRMQNMRDQLGIRANPLFSYFWLSFQSNLSPLTVFGPIWRSLSAPDRAAYRII